MSDDLPHKCEACGQFMTRVESHDSTTFYYEWDEEAKEGKGDYEQVDVDYGDSVVVTYRCSDPKCKQYDKDVEL